MNQRLPTPIQQASSSVDEAGKPNVAFRLLVDAVQDYAIFILDPDGYVLTWNSGAKAIKGYTREEIVGKHFSVFYPQEAVDSHWPERELALAVKEGRFRDEGLRVKKDGSTFWASVTITALRESDGSLYGFAKVTQDLSARRDAEERLQALNRELRTRVQQLDESRRVIELRTMELQKLSGTLLQIQDEERRRIARELHDDLAQHVTAVKMEIDASGRGRELSDAMGAILQKIRETSYLLHPPLLDEAGLRAALHWYVDGLMQRSKLQISLAFHPDVLPGVPKEIEMTIFRIIQEALANVFRHANSDSARVEVIGESERIILRVRDYGKGISARIARMESSAQLGVGITGMRERVRQLGGELSVTRAEPGTLVEARIPLNGADVLDR
ncbi:MAG TPA: PAS domain S-box protein [Candidatus Acidoferrum sp.]|nr:PAS domain S-box protein [Candidatus Acidoferrum sp.]